MHSYDVPILQNCWYRGYRKQYQRQQANNEIITHIVIQIMHIATMFIQYKPIYESHDKASNNRNQNKTGFGSNNQNDT